MSFGIDISYAQSLSIGIGSAVRGGVEFVILKAGGSNGDPRYTDSKYRTFAAWTRATSAVLGHYWFNGGSDPIGDADYFVDNLSNYQPGDILALDIENEVNSKGQIVTLRWSPSQALAFCQRVKDRLGVVPFLYMSSSVTVEDVWGPLKALGCKLWVAQYGSNNGIPGNTPRRLGVWGDDWSIWQYSSNGSIEGYTARVDVNLSSRPIRDLIDSGDDMSAEDVKQINAHTDQVLSDLEARIKTALRREGRARLYFDSGADGSVPQEKSTRAVAAVITSGYLYPLNPDAAVRQGQITSLRNTHYLLIDRDEVFEGLPTAQFNNMLEMANGHLRRIAAEVLRQLQGGVTTPVTSAVSPEGTFPTRAL